MKNVCQLFFSLTLTGDFSSTVPIKQPKKRTQNHQMMDFVNSINQG